MNQDRQGILAAGNFIVDRIKRIDAYPAENMLANIESESRSNGGGPYNVLKDLSAMGVGYPLMAAGRIGDDADGEWIVDDCQQHGIDPALLLKDPVQSTSYTDVMTVAETGRRTFFHRRGANAAFEGKRIDFEQCPARIFHLAYLLLLDGLDVFAPDGRTQASHLLEKASTAGLVTSIDIVSTENPVFREIVMSALPYADHLLINEVEAGRTLGRDVDPQDVPAIEKAARELLEMGVRQAVVLHTEFGAVRVDVHGGVFFQGSVKVPSKLIQGANGAGDGFAAGYLHGVHEGFTPEKSLEAAACVAAACLSDSSPSRGVKTIAKCLKLGRGFGFSSDPTSAL